MTSTAGRSRAAAPRSPRMSSCAASASGSACGSNCRRGCTSASASIMSRYSQSRLRGRLCGTDKEKTMPLNAAFFATWTPRAQALLRIVTAYLFLTHGTSKLLGVPHVAAFDKLQLFSLVGVGGLLELVRVLLLLLGLFTRLGPLVLRGATAPLSFIGY